MARVTLQTIADRLGVSRMTVSNAFSKPDQLSAELRARILSTAEELGYAGPDPAGRALARGSSGSVGILLTDSLEYAFTDEVAAEFVGAIARALSPTGLALTLLSSVSHDGMIPARDVPLDGAVVYSCDVFADGVGWLQRRQVPLVFVDQPPAKGVPSVNVEDRAGARAAAEHLLALGHRRIAAITSNVNGNAGFVADPAEERGGFAYRQRLLGWLDALTPAGIEPPLIQYPESHEQTGYVGAKVLLALDPRPTAVLCFSDAIAYGALRAAEELGLDVPADLSVVGFDDSPLARRVRPALTTVRQDITAKGSAAVDALVAAVDQARDGRPSRARHLVLPTELIVRDSTAPPR